MIVNFLLFWKFNKWVREKDIENNPFVWLKSFKKLLWAKTHKRPEECYKFVYNWVVKKLE